MEIDVTNYIDRDVAVLANDPRREIRDEEGRTWLVREIQNAAYDRRSSRSLIFERHEAVRRVRKYPENWFTLSDAELYALSLKP